MLEEVCQHGKCKEGPLGGLLSPPGPTPFLRLLKQPYSIKKNNPHIHPITEVEYHVEYQVEQATHSYLLNKGRCCNNSEIDTLISKRLPVENKARLSQLEIVNK